MLDEGLYPRRRFVPEKEVCTRDGGLYPRSTVFCERGRFDYERISLRWVVTSGPKNSYASSEHHQVPETISGDCRVSVFQQRAFDFNNSTGQ